MTICGRCNAPVFEDDAGWFNQIPVTQEEPAGLIVMDRNHECRGGEPHQPHRTLFDVENEAGHKSCPRCGAKPFWPCDGDGLHAERIALVPPAGPILPDLDGNQQKG